MSGGGGNSTTTVQNNNPWAPAEPYLKEVLSGSQAAYQSGKGFKPYPDATYVPFSTQTQGALTNIEALAGQGNPLATAAKSTAQNVLGSGGMSPWQQGALGQTYDVATGARSIGTEGDYRGILNDAGAPRAVSQYLTPYARGDFVTGGSPEFQAALDTQARKTGEDVNRSFSSAGRYGSGSHAGVLTDRIGDLRTRAVADQLSREQGMQMQAAGLLSGEQGQDISNRAGILNAITQGRAADIANATGAGQAIFGAGDTAATQAARYAALAPQIYQDQFAPAERLASVGSAYEGLSAQQLQDAISRWNAEQQDPWQRLAQYSALAGGAGQLGGTSSQTAQMPRNYASPLGGALSGALMGSVFPGVGTLAGGLLGGGAGLLGLL